MLKWFRGRVGGSDRGGLAVLVVVLFAGGVLLGSAALVVDVGRLHAEKAELQNGADAAAVAVAEECARQPVSCPVNGPALAAEYVNGNATDGTATVHTVCGRADSAPLTACPAPPAGRCIGDPPVGTDWVEIRAGTRTLDGSTLLPPVIAQALAGNDDYHGTEVTACARAAWGPPQRSAGVAVTISTCEWNEATSNGTRLPPQGTVPSSDSIIYLHGGPGSTTCPAGPSGWDAPGGFGWLDDTTGDCTTTVEADGSYGGDTGVSASHACKAALAATRADRATLLMPIYDGVTGNGSHTTYHLAGIAAFVLTGYALPGFSAPSTLTGQSYCKGSKKCLYGYFTRALLAAAGTLGGTDYGATIVTITG